MAGALELVGVQAVVQGIAAFERDAASVNRLLNQINSTTVGLGSRSTTAWGLVQSASSTALSAVVTGASLAVGALAALTTATVGAAAGFENSLLKAGVAAGLTGSQVDSLGATIRKVASDTSVGISDISNAANQLARSGITITDIQAGVLESTTKLSEASGGELGLAEAARLVSVAMNAWELSAKDVASVTGTLLGAANSSAIGFTDLSTSFQLSAPLAASLHISFQDLATAIAELGLAGVKGTVAGTALKTMLERLANPTKLAAELMREYQISIQDANGNIVALPEIIRRLEKALGDQTNATHKLTDAQREQIAGSLFGTRAVLDALALADKGTETFDKLSESIRNTNVEEFAAQMRQTLIPQLGVLRNQVESFIIQLGTPLEKALSAGVTNINALIRSLDPRIPQVFGAALLAIFSIGGGANIGAQLTDVFGPQLGQALTGILDIVFSVRDAITTQLVPAFRILFAAITSGIDVTGGLGNTFETIAGAIRTVANDVALAIVVFSQFVAQLRSSADSSATLSTALKAIVVSPFVGLALSLLRVAVAFASLGAQLAIVSVAFAGMTDIVRRLSLTFDGSFASIVEGVRRLPPELSLLLAAVLAVATVIGVNLAFDAVSAATRAFILFSAPIDRVLNNLINMSGAIAANVIPAVVAFTARMVFATISVLTFAVAVAVQGVVAVGAFTASLLASLPVVGAFLAGISPLILGVAAIALVVGVAYLAISTNFLGIRDAIVNSVGPAAAIIRDILLVVLGILVVAVGAAVSAVSSLVASFPTITSSAASAIVSISGIIESLSNFVQGMILAGSGILATSGVIQSAFSAVAGIVGPVIQYVIDRLNDFFNTIGAIPIVRDELNRLGVTFLSLRDTGAGAVSQLQKAVAEQLAAAQIAFQNWSTTAGTAADAAKIAFAGFVNSLAASLGLANIALQQSSIVMSEWAANLNHVQGLTSEYGGLANRPAPQISPIGIPEIPSFGSPTALSLPSSGRGGAKPPKATVDELAASYVGLLAGIRGNVQELAKFLAELEQANPGRINGMIAALQSMKGLISDIADQYQRVLAVQYAISKVQQDLDAVNAQITANQAANAEATFTLKTQILLLDQQSLALQQQLTPLEQESLAIQQQLLPIQQEIAAVNQQITDAQRVNYVQQGQLLDLQQQELPIKQKIVDLNTQINRVEDQRLTLLKRQQEIVAQQSLDNLNRQLDTTNQNLNTAWQKLNVPQILALEKQKQSLTDSITSAQNSLNSIQDAQKTTRENNELTTIQLQLQVVAYQDMLKPLDDQIVAIDNIKAAQDAATAIVVNNLNLQKQRLEDLAAPLEAQITAIKNQTDAINLQIATIRAQTDAINLQIAVVNNQFQIANQQFELKKLQDQTEIANLQVIKNEEDARYAALIADYINTAVQSGAFSASEAAETVKRLKLWDSSADAVANIAAQFDSLTAAAAAANAEIALIPTDVTVRVHFSADTVPSYQYGGTVGGPIGSPQLIIAHGGEQFLGVGASKVPVTSSSAQRGGANVVNNYNVNATYAQKQSPASIGMDIRAIIAMSRH